MTNKIFILFALVLFICSCKEPNLIPLQQNGTEKFHLQNLGPFYHGVASGDPLEDRVVIWTRVTPEGHQSVAVEWEIATDKDFSSVVNTGTSKTDSTKDYTIKVDVDGLSPSSRYFYRFKVLDKYSPIGRTKTLNTSDSNISLGVVSCSNYEWGYFSAYGHLAKKDLDAVLHLGDYFYEYAPGRYGDTTIGRFNIPPREIVSLSDYRTRYALYRLDEDLQALHQAHPFIGIWDDHEITNNAYISGAQNHQEEEGDYNIRKSIAKQAYYEWIPIRDMPGDVHYRSFKLGNLAELIMLDERLAGRTKQADSLSQVDETYSMLGQQQLDWFESKMQNSEATWKIIGNQVIFSPVDFTVLNPNRPANLDAWDGYAVERDGIIDHIRSEEISNVVFLTGDTHTSWAFEVPSSIESYKQGGNNVAIEFGTTSITSANWNESRTDEEVIESEQKVLSSNPHLKYINARDHGYLLLSVAENGVKGEFYYVSDLKQKDTPERLAQTFLVSKNSNRLTTTEQNK